MRCLQKTNKKELCFSKSLYFKDSLILPTDQTEFSIGKKGPTVVNSMLMRLCKSWLLTTHPKAIFFSVTQPTVTLTPDPRIFFFLF